MSVLKESGLYHIAILGGNTLAAVNADITNGTTFEFSFWTENKKVYRAIMSSNHILPLSWVSSMVKRFRTRPFNSIGEFQNYHVDIQVIGQDIGAYLDYNKHGVLELCNIVLPVLAYWQKEKVVYASNKFVTDGCVSKDNTFTPPHQFDFIMNALNCTIEEHNRWCHSTANKEHVIIRKKPKIKVVPKEVKQKPSEKWW